MSEWALYTQLGVFIAVAIAYGTSRSASFFHPVTFYLLFHFICFVLRPFLIHFLNFNRVWIYMGYVPTPEQFNFTLFVTTVGMLTFVAACWPTARTNLDFSAARLNEFTQAENWALTWTWVLLGPLALYSASFAVKPIGIDDDSSAIQMTQDMVTGQTIFVNTTGYLVDAQTMLSPLVIMMMWRFRFALWTWILPAAFLAYRTVLGSRWLIVAMAFTLIMIYLLRKQKKWFQVRFVAVIFPLFILFQNMGADRNYLRDAVNGTDRVSHTLQYKDNRTWLQKQDSPDFANFDFLAFILWVVPNRSHTYTYFTQYLQLFTEPIPRILWPDKPVGPPIRLINFNDYGNFVGLTDSLIGDGWKSAGWLGLIVTMGIVGFGLGVMHRQFWRRLHNPSSVIFYCTFLPLTITWFRDGGIYIAKYALFTIFPILVWRGLTWVSIDLQRGREEFTSPNSYYNRGRRRR